ncbi:MAG: Cytochrome P450 [uncultured Solirubrobacterales bacterium]|uniref:Cytochrome P450 n=1 Tax=uncultured Solirubrobacterales bacterium TaxID=768556 RepID=A0A6J4ST72_9ACTN|nr:MAG: Cytochrome P450 [uncultured Solirubrobacterales bacterium]
MREKLPPGPPYPSALQTLGWWTRPVAFLERCRARYGKRFTIRLLGTPPFVMVCDPEEIKQIFTAPPEVLHPGEGARILEPVVGRNSVILLDEDRHLEQRKLMLPAFHGERMERLTGLMTEVAEREAARWPLDEPVALHSRLQGLTLEIILRAVFGLDPGPRLEGLREKLTEILELGTRPTGMLPFMQRDLGPLTSFARFARLRAETDELLFELIAERRAEPAQRDDVLAMLLEARHEEDGSEMSAQELRDELMTLLVAGHETTASELAWGFEQLVRAPGVLRRLVAEVDDDDPDDAYLTATIQETLRRRPVLPNAAPRLVKEPTEIGGCTYPAGVCVVPQSYLVHHDPEIYEDPYSFRPERFLDEPPGTYTWIPFGGGRRRCLGASFAMLEMKVVIRAVLARAEVNAGLDGPELTRRRSITLSPGRGAVTALHARTPVAA